MRILHIFDHSVPLHSGYTFRSLSLLREQRGFGWQTAQLTSPKHGTFKSLTEEADGFQFYRTPSPSKQHIHIPVLSELRLMSALGKRIDEVLEEQKPDLIHAHSPVLNGWPALKAARRHLIPMAYEIRAFWEDAAVDHGTTAEGSLRYRATQYFETWVAKQADAVFTICEGLRQDLVARGISPQKITVIPNAVDAEKFTLGSQPDLALRHALNLEQSKVLGFIGSFYAYEGLDLLIDAVPELVRSVPQLKVLLVGGGPQEASLKERVAHLGLQDRVLFVGRVPNSEVTKYYDLIDLLVYPRRSMRLTELVTPLKPLEAMAQGRLFIASDVGGHRELIQHDATGWLFPAGSPSALANTAVRVLSEEQRWPTIKAFARDFVEQQRTWRASAERYRSVYTQLLQNRVQRAI